MTVGAEDEGVVRVLLVEDHKPDAAFIRRRLAEAESTRFSVEEVGWLSSALTLLRNRPFDVILLDLTLPDSRGVDTVVSVIREAPNSTVIVLSGQEDLETAINSVRTGAQSFVVKSRVLTASNLEREITYAMERHRSREVDRRLSIQSLGYAIGQRSKSSPPAELVGPHLRILERAVDGLLTYLAKDSPRRHEDAVHILEAEGFHRSLREVRALLQIGAHPKVTQSQTGRVLHDAVDDVTDKPIRDEADAQEAILAALESEDGDE